MATYTKSRELLVDRDNINNRVWQVYTRLKDMSTIGSCLLTAI